MIPSFTLTGETTIPALGLGTWQLTGDACTAAVEAALSLGYTHIDTAMFYKNHAEIAKAIAGNDREHLFITSKVWPQSLAYQNVLDACEQTLTELNTPYLDLWLIHWPNSAVPMETTFKAMKHLVEEGKVRAVGVSNFTIDHLKQALAVSEIPIVINQVEYHPFLFQHELRDFCAEQNIRLTAYSPLARGEIFENATLQGIAKKHGCSEGDVALKWLHDQGIVVIPKATSKEHLQANMAFFDLELDDADREQIASLPRKRLVNPPFAEFDE